MLGPILAILGVIIIVVAAVNHFTGILGTSVPHLSIYLGVVGVIVLALGGWLTMQGRRAAA